MIEYKQVFVRVQSVVFGVRDQRLDRRELEVIGPPNMLEVFANHFGVSDVSSQDTFATTRRADHRDELVLQHGLLKGLFQLRTSKETT